MNDEPRSVRWSPVGISNYDFNAGIRNTTAMIRA